MRLSSPNPVLSFPSISSSTTGATFLSAAVIKSTPATLDTPTASWSNSSPNHSARPASHVLFFSVWVSVTPSQPLERHFPNKRRPLSFCRNQASSLTGFQITYQPIPSMMNGSISIIGPPSSLSRKNSAAFKRLLPTWTTSTLSHQRVGHSPRATSLQF